MTGAVTCARSRRPDGEHGWRFDGDDPYLICAWCGRHVDALTGKVLAEGRADRPSRVRMSRQHPWRAENPDAVVVARPGRWGNPWRVRRGYNDGQWEVVERIPDLGETGVGYAGSLREARALAVAVFRQVLVLGDGERPEYPGPEEIRRDLAGRDLACWCPLDQPCHADVLLELANPEVRDA